MAEVVAVPPIRLREYAFFFDVDGTLAKIQPHPDQVTLPVNVIDALRQVHHATHGALALISGRSMHELDTLVRPLKLALAGIHGAERRDINGHVHLISLSAETQVKLRACLQAGVARLDGVYLEDKGNAFAVHYRNNPLMHSAVTDLAQRCVAGEPTLALQPGKCVLEIKPQSASKGAAITSFMAETPFIARRPLFIGDDVTDEAGFRVVNDLNGISIKVGKGETQARFRLASVVAVWDWLSTLVSYQSISPYLDNRSHL